MTDQQVLEIEDEVPGDAQSDQDDPRESGPDDHYGEYDGWSQEEWQEEGEDDEKNPDASAADEEFSPVDAEAKVRALKEKNEKMKEKLKS